MTYDLGDYKEVHERIQDFREKHPDGTLQSEVIPSPAEGFIVVKAYAFRTADDERPGVGLAWEPVPGKTPYTKDSELMNAETSAWGRAIIAVGASDAKHGVASANEVRNRQESPHLTDVQLQALDAVKALDPDGKGLVKEWMEAEDLPVQFGKLTDDQAKAVLDHVESLGAPF